MGFGEARSAPRDLGRGGEAARAGPGLPGALLTGRAQHRGQRPVRPPPPHRIGSDPGAPRPRTLAPTPLTVAVDEDDGQHVVLAQHGPCATPARPPRPPLS